MIVRRYGSTVQRVTPNFDAHAMNEVGFLREGSWSMPVAEFESKYAKGQVHELSAESAGDVQAEVENAVLNELHDKLVGIEKALGQGALLMVENQPGKDQPKTRSTQSTRVAGTDNRLHFQYSIDPPLRVSVWQPGS
jgi:hypothetical protein